MRIINRKAQQGHAVPKRIIEPMGPFRRYEPVVVPLEPEVEYLPGATAQNDMRGIVIYECRYCGGLVREDQMGDHLCAGDPEV